MNAVLIAVAVMLVLSLLRVNVVFALLVGAISGGLAGGLSMTDTITAFTEGLGGGASIALSYALLGGFAVAISKTGIPELACCKHSKLIKKDGDTEKTAIGKNANHFGITSNGCIFSEFNSDSYCFYSITCSTYYSCDEFT